MSYHSVGKPTLGGALKVSEVKEELKSKSWRQNDLIVKCVSEQLLDLIFDSLQVRETISI